MEEVKRLEVVYKRNPTKENERQYKRALVQLCKNTLASQQIKYSLANNTKKHPIDKKILSSLTTKKAPQFDTVLKHN